MPALRSIKHERFCRAFARRLLAGEALNLARHGAYVETIYQGGEPNGISSNANSRRLSNRSEIKGRVEELLLEGQTPSPPLESKSIDPLLAEHCRLLPPSGSVWPKDARVAWLHKLYEYFVLVYKPAANDESPSEIDKITR